MQLQPSRDVKPADVPPEGPRTVAPNGGVTIRALTKRYGSVVAVDGLSLDIAAGSFVAILGPSGSGKTTLLSLLAGFLEPDEGTISIAGRPMERCPPYERGLGVVFQHYALFPHMDVAGNIAFPLEMRGWPRQVIRAKVEAAMAMVELTGLASRRPAQLSGGQQQRVALARALVYEPSVLLLDEPLGALDRRLRDAMQMELKDLHERVGTTFVYVTHDQEEALSLSDLVVVMRDGHIEQLGSPREVYDRPRTEFVANFVGDCNVLGGTVEATQGGLAVREPSSGMLLHRGDAVAALHPGDRATVAIRPEWFTVSGEGEAVPDGWACVDAAILQQRFLGHELIARCASSVGDLLVRVGRVRRGPTARADDMHTDDGGAERVHVAWNPTTTVLLEPGP
jgi:ABC-type Fe3+/spermidine/putrescine transport system ATPase subunit